jgi:hypothetical protein
MLRGDDRHNEPFFVSNQFIASIIVADPLLQDHFHVPHLLSQAHYPYTWNIQKRCCFLMELGLGILSLVSRNKSGLMRSPSCLLVWLCMCIPVSTINAWIKLYKIWYVYIMPSEPISMTPFQNPFHLQYQHYNPSTRWDKSLIFLYICTNLQGTCFMHHAAWAHLNVKLHNSFPSIIPTLQPFKFLPTLQPFKFLWQNSTIHSTHVSPSWNLVCISCHLSPSEWRTL